MIPMLFIYRPAIYRPAPDVRRVARFFHFLPGHLAAALKSILLCGVLLCLLLPPSVAQAQAPQTVTAFLPDTDIFFDEDRATWMRYTTVPGISYTLERTLDQQTWTAVPEGSVYGTGPDMEIMVKHPSVIVPGDPLPPPPHPVYRYFIAVLGNGQAHVTCLPSMGTGVHYAMISWPFAQNAFPGIGVYGALIEPKARYPSVANVPYAVTFDAWALAPNPALLPTTPNPTAAQQLRMTRLLDAIPWIEHDLTENSPLVANGPPQPAAAITAADRSYFRVRVQFLDSDSDGLSDHVELADGTSPFVSDSDGDGLSDAVEKTNGTSGSVYNIPDLTLESSSRTLIIEDSGSAPAGAETLSAQANGLDLSLASLPANLRWAVIPGDDHGGELNSIVAVPHFITKMNALPATALREAGGWSKWEPFSGADMARYSNVRQYVPQASNPPSTHLQSHKLVLTEYRYRIHASHSMAHAWPAVLQVKAASRENALGGTSGLGWQLATNVLPAGAAANKHVRLTLAAGQTDSPVVVFTFPFVDNFFNREFRTGILRPRVAVTPADVDAETLSPTGLFASISTLDPDTDGVVLPAELALGSSTTTWNSTGDAVPDSHKPVEGLNGDNFFPEIRERVMQWGRVPYAVYPKPKETFLSTASWSGPPQQEQQTALVTDPDDLGAELTTDWQWPFSALSDRAPAGALLSTATLTPLGSGSGLCHHAIVTHRQVRLRRYPFVGKPERSLHYLKVTERSINGGTPTGSKQHVALTFPAGQEYTGTQELLPALAAKKTDLAQARTEDAKVELQQIKLTLDKVEVLSGNLPDGFGILRKHAEIGSDVKRRVDKDSQVIVQNNLALASLVARESDKSTARAVKLKEHSTEIFGRFLEISERPTQDEREPSLRGTISLKLNAQGNLEHDIQRQIAEIPSGGGYGGEPGGIGHITYWTHNKEDEADGVYETERFFLMVQAHHGWNQCAGGNSVGNGLLGGAGNTHVGDVYQRAVGHTEETHTDLPLAQRPSDSRPVDRLDLGGKKFGLISGPGTFSEEDDLERNDWKPWLTWKYQYQDVVPSPWPRLRHRDKLVAGGTLANVNDIQVSPARSLRQSVKSALLQEQRFQAGGNGSRIHQFETPTDGGSSIAGYKLTFLKKAVKK